MSFPNTGFKKPLNQLENPVYPDIRKGAPRFKWSGKYWQVDQGRTMIENTQQIPHNMIDTILVQNRDYNRQIAYGKSSHRDVVNLEFRPPLIDRDDVLPLSRIPRSTVVPRMNPGTANDSNTNGFVMQNGSISELGGYLEDRIVDPGWMQSFCAPTELYSITDNPPVLPDLECKMPSYSVSSGYQPIYFSEFEKKNVQLDFERINPKFNPGFQSSITNDGYNAAQDTIFEDSNLPSRSVSAGFTSDMRIGQTPIDYEFELNRPNVSVSSGYNTDIRNNNQSRSDIELHQRNVGGKNIIANPEYQFKQNRLNSENHNGKIIQKKPNYSYVVESNPIYKTENERTSQLAFQEKKPALTAQQGFNPQSYIPRSGIDSASVNLKKTFKSY